MVWPGLVLARLALSLALSAPAALAAGALPPLVLEDQDGRTLRLESLRGRMVVIVYGVRAGVDDHVLWGRRLDEMLRAHGAYRADDPPAARPVLILAVAQMGAIPAVFRPVIRAALRPHVEKGHSLWLDWEDRMSASFGARDGRSTVVVADREGGVRLVVSGPPEGVPLESVNAELRRLM